MCEFHHFQFQQKEPHCWGSSSLCELHFVIGLLLLCYYFHQNPLGGKSQPLTHHWVLNLKVVWTNTPQHWCTFLNASDSSPSKPLQYLTSHHIWNEKSWSAWSEVIINQYYILYYLVFLSLFSRETISEDRRSSQGFSGMKLANPGDRSHLQSAERKGRQLPKQRGCNILPAKVCITQ